MGANSSLLGFFNRYRAFTVFMLGGVLVFFAHFLVAYFAIQVIEPIGGDSTDLGMTCFLSAIGEVPVMLLFIYINRKFSAHALLRFTAVMFVVKQILIFLATSIPCVLRCTIAANGGIWPVYPRLCGLCESIDAGRGSGPRPDFDDRGADDWQRICEHGWRYPFGCCRCAGDALHQRYRIVCRSRGHACGEQIGRDVPRTGHRGIK